MFPRILNLGDCGVTVEFGNDISPATNDQVLALSAQLDEIQMPGIIEVVPTYRSVTVYYAPQDMNVKALTSKLKDLIRSRPTQQHKTSRLIEIPVFYGGESGPDLVELAKRARISSEKVVNLHCSVEYRVYMLGFNPGFPYLGTVPETIAIPRLSEPRLNVPAGSVGIAGQQTGIYPQDSPGGWRIIGQTPIHLYDVSRKNPFFLKAGDRVRFHSIHQDEFVSLQE